MFINASKYKDVLEKFVARHFAEKNYTFQGDSASVHRARTVVEYKQKMKSLH